MIFWGSLTCLMIHNFSFSIFLGPVVPNNKWIAFIIPHSCISMHVRCLFWQFFEIFSIITEKIHLMAHFFIWIALESKLPVTSIHIINIKAQKDLLFWHMICSTCSKKELKWQIILSFKGTFLGLYSGLHH